ncbi:hypothetical protein [Lutibacter sp.]|uniref:hypothetical protein n=1 Tax=Lutibacter sp. TaxID=1925666 RepID=UPI001A2E726C|nr:hypothetical protein [Lutibacter sp.]MBI9042829.1 hypothetical protein [Lutibacter sp.]
MIDLLKIVNSQNLINRDIKKTKEIKPYMSESREKILSPEKLSNHKDFDWKNYKIISSKKELEEFIDNNEFKFVNCIFNLDVDFNNFIFDKETTFHESIFVGKANFSFSEFGAEISNFFNVTFLDVVDFETTIFRSREICFRSSTFKKSANFMDTQFAGKLDLQYCNFSGEVLLNYANKFNKTLNTPLKIELDGSTFEKKVIFYNRHFDSSSFSNTKFKALSDFFNASFNEDMCFDKTDFLGTTVFAEAKFYKKAIFLYTQVSRNMILRNTQFLGGVNLALINFIGEGYINTLEIKIHDVPSDGIVSENTYDYLNEKINVSHKRASYRILKHEALKQNNKIDALVFHGVEMQTHLKELNEIKRLVNKSLNLLISRYRKVHKSFINLQLFKLKTKKYLPVKWVLIFTIFNSHILKIKRFKHDDRGFWNRWILRLNKFSNNFGLNPGRGIAFTVLTTIVFYFIFLIFLSKECNCLEFDIKNLGETFKYGVQFFNLSKWDYEPYKIDTYNWALIVLVFGRIFIGFGMYQTIQAFRKYGRF